MGNCLGKKSSKTKDDYPYRPSPSSISEAPLSPETPESPETPRPATKPESSDSGYQTALTEISEYLTPTFNPQKSDGSPSCSDKCQPSQVEPANSDATVETCCPAKLGNTPKEIVDKATSVPEEDEEAGSETRNTVTSIPETVKESGILDELAAIPGKIMDYIAPGDSDQDQKTSPDAGSTATDGNEEEGVLRCFILTKGNPMPSTKTVQSDLEKHFPQLDFSLFDFDELDEILKKEFGTHITIFPGYVIFKDNHVLDYLNGSMSVDQIKEKIGQILDDDKAA